MIAVIARPKDFEGKFLLLVGFANVEFESTALYLSREDAELSIPKNMIAMDLSGLPKDVKTKKFHKTYVEVEGTFVAEESLVVSGTIKVTDISPWRAKKE